MGYRHNQDYHGRVPAGPEPEFVETAFGTAIVYANERGNVVAQTADPGNPLALDRCTFDIATEYAWDGSGSLTGPSSILSRPDHMRWEQATERQNSVYKALADLIHPYAARHARELAELAINDIEVRLDDVRERQAQLLETISEGNGREGEFLLVPVYRDLPIGPVLVTLPTSNAFQIHGLGFGGTCVVEGRPVEYKANLPVDTYKSPYTTIRPVGGDRPEWYPDKDNALMLTNLRDELVKLYSTEIRMVEQGEQLAEARTELDKLHMDYAELDRRRSFLENRVNELSDGMTDAPVM